MTQKVKPHTNFITSEARFFFMFSELNKKKIEKQKRNAKKIAKYNVLHKRTPATNNRFAQWLGLGNFLRINAVQSKLICMFVMFSL